MNYRYVVGTSIIVAAFAAVISSSLRSNILPAMPVGAVRAADSTGHPYVGQRLRLRGFVSADPVHDTTVSTASGTVPVHNFTVINGKARVMVHYKDVLPDTFKPGGTVQVDGVYSAPGEMQADHVMTKCPSKYQAEELKKS